MSSTRSPAPVRESKRSPADNGAGGVGLTVGVSHSFALAVQEALFNGGRPLPLSSISTSASSRSTLACRLSPRLHHQQHQRQIGLQTVYEEKKVLLDQPPARRGHPSRGLWLARPVRQAQGGIHRLAARRGTRGATVGFTTHWRSCTSLLHLTRLPPELVGTSITWPRV